MREFPCLPTLVAAILVMALPVDASAERISGALSSETGHTASPASKQEVRKNLPEAAPIVFPAPAGLRAVVADSRLPASTDADGAFRVAFVHGPLGPTEEAEIREKMLLSLKQAEEVFAPRRFELAGFLELNDWEPVLPIGEELQRVEADPRVQAFKRDTYSHFLQFWGYGYTDACAVTYTHCVPNPDRNYSVMDIDCAWKYSGVHEFGHNGFGLSHEPEATIGASCAPYAQGHSWPMNDGYHGSLMAVGGMRELRLSNGIPPTGVPDERDNQRAYNEIAAAMVASVSVPDDFCQATPCEFFDDTSLCLMGNRFKITAEFDPPNDDDDLFELGHAFPLDDSPQAGGSGTFWFFDDTNKELLVKVINACPVNNHMWFFAGGLTNVNVRLKVCDTHHGVQRVYVNPQSTPFQPIQDTSAFATCN